MLDYLSALLGSVAGILKLAPRRSSRWKSVRDQFLVNYPRCAACGRTTHLNVHHRIPFHQRPDLELDVTNLITLCEYPTWNCHLWIGHLGRWDAWNDHVELDAVTLRQEVMGRIVAERSAA